MEQLIGIILIIVFASASIGFLNTIAYGLILIIIVILSMILLYYIYDKLNIDEKIGDILGKVFVFSLIGIFVYIFGYSVLYEGMHGKPTAFFKSKETIEKDKEEKQKQLESDILNKATLETSYAWKYIDDYNIHVQRTAIDKLEKFKYIDKIKQKFIEMGSSGYQDMSVRDDTLCTLQNEADSYQDIANAINSFSSYSSHCLYGLRDSCRIVESCLNEESIKNSSSIRKAIIHKYRSAPSDYERIMQLALKYEEVTRNEYVKYLINRDSFSRFFSFEAWFEYFNNEDLLRVLSALSNRELILGDKHVKDAIVDVLKMDDPKIIKIASKALREAYKWDDDALNILASHLKSEDEEVRHEAIFALESFYATSDPSVVSKIIPMLDDSNAYNRKLAIKTLKPLFNNYSETKNKNDESSQLIIKAYNKIIELSKHDLSESVRDQAKSTIR